MGMWTVWTDMPNSRGVFLYKINNETIKTGGNYYENEEVSRNFNERYVDVRVAYGAGWSIDR